MTKILDDTFADFFGSDDAEDKCDACGTTLNLTVHFGMNEQTGKYSKHLCATCNAKAVAKRTTANMKRNAETTRNIYIAETDN